MTSATIGIEESAQRLWDVAVIGAGPARAMAAYMLSRRGATVLAPSREILQQHGNMSSPTLLFILEQLRREKAPTPCVALGFGPGLALEMALLK